MSIDQELTSAGVNGIRLTLGIAGILTLIAGVLILVWPGQTAAVVTGILAVYTIAAGLVYAGLGLFAKDRGGWGRLGYVLLGVLFVVAGIVAFMNLTETKLLLAVFVAIFVGIAWIVEGVVSLSTIGDSSSKVWTVIFAIISIIAGIYLLLSPLWGAVVLWWVLGIMLVAMGVVNIVRAFTFGKNV